MSSRVFHIDDSLDGASLSQALKQFLRDRSWSEVKRLIAMRHVQVHGNLCLDEGRRLKLGDVVKFFDEALDKPPAADDVVILYRDAHLAIVEKPPGVTTQREPRETASGRAQRQATLDELLQQALDRLGPLREKSADATVKPVPKANDDGFIVRRRTADAAPRGSVSKPARAVVRPVHRLDRDTSGLMMFALSPEAETKLAAMFRQHSVERVYRAVVVGHVSGPMRIESMIARDRGDGVRGSTTDPAAPERQQAITHVRPIESVDGQAYTIVECRLETGRTHQIRIHLAERGHMLCGEKTYVRPSPSTPPTRDASGAPRHALHSARLALAHPITGQRIELFSDWPRDLGKWLERLRGAPKQ